MSFSLTLGSVFGTAVRLHITFLLLLAAIGGVTYAQGGLGVALTTVGFLAAIFVCVILHEFGHILAARRYGVRTADVILLPIGGVARMERMPETPGQEIVVALAGPAVNVAIAAMLVLALGGFPPLADTMQSGWSGFAGRLLYANVLLVAFNLLPAFPMDGGRVLRALLATWRGHAQGTLIAARLGQGFAIILGVLGLAGGNVLLALVGVFIFFAAGSENRAARMRHASSGLRNSDAMMTLFARLDRGSTLAEALDCRLRTGQGVVPICDSTGIVAGILTRQSIIGALKRNGPGTPVVELMASDVRVVGVRDQLEETSRLLQESNCPALGVVGDDGRLVGLVTRESIDDVLAIHEAKNSGRMGNSVGRFASHGAE